MGMQVNLWERAKTCRYMQHFLVGCGKNECYHALNNQAIICGDDGKSVKHDIFSVLPEMVALFVWNDPI